MADPKAVAFTPAAAKRISKVVRRVEDTPTDFTGRGNQETYSREIWAAITSRAFASGIWKHAWTQQRELGEGTFEDMPGGLSGTTSANYATESDPTIPVDVDRILRLQIGFRWDTGSGVWVQTFRVSVGPPGPHMLHISSSATPGGCYNAYILTRPTSDVPAGSNLETDDMGGAGDNVLALNVKEEGASTHDLIDSGSDDLDAMGIYRCTNSDGTIVYAIDKIQVGCDDSGGG